MEQEPRLKKNRIFLILLVIVGLLFIWNVRLFWIQVVAPHHFAGKHIDLVENSVLQREQGIVLNSGRGDFYDRNGVPLTGKEWKVLTVFPIQDEDGGLGRKEADAQRIAQILHIPIGQWNDFVKGLKTPRIWPGNKVPYHLRDAQAKQIEDLELTGVRVMQYKQRYDEKQTAGQLIGYISQNPERITRQFTDQFHKGELQLTSKIGNAGLEKTFEPWLQGIGATTVSLFTDALKRPMPGLGTRVVTPDNPYYPLKVVTTLESAVQKEIERRMERLQIEEGAAVVLDINNADTMAVASRPVFNPEHVDLANEGWSNRALKAAAPGSIFKIITAAAALEEKAAAPDEYFQCDGELGKYGFTCWKKGGHGLITMEEGFAQSCNIVFAKVAERLGGDKLEQYARKLGLGELVGWHGEVPGQRSFMQWDGEENGQIYHSEAEKADGGALVQTAIGQRDVLVTPIQAANLIVTLYHQGTVLSPRIVQEIRFQNDRLYQAFPSKKRDHSSERPIHPTTSKQLLEFMEEVVDHGTGKALKAAKWSLAGKSGTAQVKLKNGSPGENHWFIGLGPVENPRYAVAVLIQNVPEGQKNKSIPLFREVMDVLAAYEQNDH